MKKTVEIVGFDEQRIGRMLKLDPSTFQHQFAQRVRNWMSSVDVELSFFNTLSTLRIPDDKSVLITLGGSEVDVKMREEALNEAGIDVEICEELIIDLKQRMQDPVALVATGSERSLAAAERTPCFG